MPLLNKLYFQFRHFFSGRFPKIYCLCENYKAVVKFFISGCLAGGTDLIFLFIFYDLFNWGLVVSTSAAFVLSFLVSFTLQKFWTFRNYRKEMFSQLFLYILNAFIGLNVNAFLMHLLVNRLHIWYILSQIIVNIFLGVYNFLVYKFIIFKNEKHEVNCQ
jgi:putative flippase GtrA